MRRWFRRKRRGTVSVYITVDPASLEQFRADMEAAAERITFVLKARSAA